MFYMIKKADEIVIKNIKKIVLMNKQKIDFNTQFEILDTKLNIENVSKSQYIKSVQKIIPDNIFYNCCASLEIKKHHSLIKKWKVDGYSELEIYFELERRNYMFLENLNMHISYEIFLKNLLDINKRTKK